MNTSGYSWSKPAPTTTTKPSVPRTTNDASYAYKAPTTSSPAPSVPRTTNDAQYLTPTQLATIAANAANYNPTTSSGSSSGSSTPAYSAPPPAYVPPPPPTAAYAGPAPTLTPPTPVTANAAAGLQNALGESFTRLGGGTAGAFERERQARGPRSTTSITPEMLMRIARQRFSQQR